MIQKIQARGNICDHMTCYLKWFHMWYLLELFDMTQVDLIVCMLEREQLCNY